MANGGIAPCNRIKEMQSSNGHVLNRLGREDITFRLFSIDVGIVYSPVR
jgi:hypothetical protein